jgi:hypothetical protein
MDGLLEYSALRFLSDHGTIIIALMGTIGLAGLGTDRMLLFFFCDIF